MTLGSSAFRHRRVHRNVKSPWTTRWWTGPAQSGRGSELRRQAVRRAIQRHIEDELSEFMIRHKDSVPEGIDFTMNGEEVLLMPRAIEELTQ